MLTLDDTSQLVTMISDLDDMGSAIRLGELVENVGGGDFNEAAIALYAASQHINLAEMELRKARLLINREHTGE